jgi:dolichyl-phosphate-mannose-protein mannosyltransferase
MNKLTVMRVLLALFLVRLAFSLLPSFQVDMSAWLAWAHRLATSGTTAFYSDDVWTQYTPGYLYYLLLIGRLGLIDPLAVKISVILADLVTATLMWRVVSLTHKRVAHWLFVLYVLNPVIIFDGSVWGQIDGILTLAMMGSAYFLLEKKRHLVSYGLAGVALLIKPQAIAMIPILLILTVARIGWRKLLSGLLTTALVVFIGFCPFFPTNPVFGPVELIQKMGVSYPYTSLFAFNIWSYVGMWQVDSLEFLNLSYFSWGVIAVSLALSTSLFAFRHRLKEKQVAYLLFALSCLIFFLFPTRVHERYLFPFFSFVMVYAGKARNTYLTVSIALISMLYTLTLYVPYSHYESVSNALKNPALETLILGNQSIIATIFLLFFFGLIAFAHYFQVGKKAKRVVQ